jgi:hypothetical protein
LSSKSTVADTRNGRRSTGPRSVSGKARSAQNARRHGFAAARPLGDSASKEIEDLARKLAGDTPDPERLVHAHRAAEMEVMLSRICEARVNLVNAHLTKRELPDGTQRYGSAAAAPLEGDRAPQQGPRSKNGFAEVEALLEVLPELLQLERYEACALAGRRRALLLLNR